MKHGKSKLRFWRQGQKSKTKAYYKKQSHKQERQMNKKEETK